MHKKSLKILKSKEFHDQVVSINKKVEEKEISELTAKKQLELLGEKLPENCLTNTVEYIINRYKLPANYEDSIRTYIVSNILHAPPRNFSERSYYMTEPLDRFESPKSVTITFNTKLTEDILMEVKKYVNKHITKSLAEEFPPIKDLDKKLAIEELWNHRTVFDHVTGKNEKMTASAIAMIITEKFPPHNTTAANVYDAIRELKDLRKSHFG